MSENAVNKKTGLSDKKLLAGRNLSAGKRFLFFQLKTCQSEKH